MSLCKTHSKSLGIPDSHHCNYLRNPTDNQHSSIRLLLRI